MATKQLLISQMIEEIGPLPKRWQSKRDTNALETHLEDNVTLERWMLELYFDSHKTPQFTESQIMSWAGLIRELMKFEPAERMSASTCLQLDLFQEQPVHHWSEQHRCYVARP